MVTSSCPDAAHSIFASEKLFGSPLTIYSLFGPPTLSITITDEEDEGLMVLEGLIVDVDVTKPEVFKVAVSVWEG